MARDPRGESLGHHAGLIRLRRRRVGRWIGLLRPQAHGTSRPSGRVSTAQPFYVTLRDSGGPPARRASERLPSLARRAGGPPAKSRTLLNAARTPAART